MASILSNVKIFFLNQSQNKKPQLVHLMASAWACGLDASALKKNLPTTPTEEARQCE